MMRLFNCVLKDPAGRRETHPPKGLLLDALPLAADVWPQTVKHCGLVVFRELAVPLQPGRSPQGHTNNVFVNVLTAVHGDIRMISERLTLCAAATRRRDLLEGFRRSSVSVLTEDVVEDVFLEFRSL